MFFIFLLVTSRSNVEFIQVIEAFRFSAAMRLVLAIIVLDCANELCLWFSHNGWQIRMYTILIFYKECQILIVSQNTKEMFGELSFSEE